MRNLFRNSQAEARQFIKDASKAYPFGRKNEELAIQLRIANALERIADKLEEEIIVENKL